ncbi:uncharacterized protein B0T15DRAFT_324695 [Chaetomium strumarium]|uniref:Uncharacterized protein n=1 Tax=Chaetomium strumarium TaxID=1170767 RepID=A0AAJ0GKW8_9PEZI|nr:hypothetical protein B0T15DRAFT_324695 [Chaetomium strumarium]
MARKGPDAMLNPFGRSFNHPYALRSACILRAKQAAINIYLHSRTPLPFARKIAPYSTVKIGHLDLSINSFNMPSSRRRKSPARSSGVAPEILHQLGRLALSYSLKKLSEPRAQARQRDQSARQRSRHSKTRNGSSASKRGSSSRDMPRSDSSSSSDDLHGLVSQLAVGAVAFGIRQVVRRRREAKRQAAAAAQATAAERSATSGPDAAIDGELSAALDAVTRELQGACESIRRLAYSAPPSHRNCEVRDALAADAERLSGSLANMQASIHNMRNLHPRLDGAKSVVRGRSRRERGEAVDRDREVSMAATGEREARRGGRRSGKDRREDSRGVRGRGVQRGIDRLHDQRRRSSYSSR